MNKSDLIDKIEEIQHRANKENIGSNEAELQAREEIADLFYSLVKNSDLLHSVMSCYVKEIDQFYEDTGYCDNTNRWGIRKNDKRGNAWQFKNPSQMIKDWMKWKRNNA